MFSSYRKTVSEEDSMRPSDVERDNARLRALLRILRARFATAVPGDYLVTDGGDLDGPYPDAAQAAKNCAAEGLACTVVTVGGRFEAEAEPEDFGLRAGRDYPSTLCKSRLTLEF
jgi:hypothetical protein